MKFHAGQYSNHPLDNLVSEENIRDILRALTWNQMIAIALRLEGLSNIQIAAMLGVSKMAITHRFRTAKERVTRFVPEVADSVAGRAFPPGPTTDWRGSGTPLEWGYLCEETKGEEAK